MKYEIDGELVETEPTDIEYARIGKRILVRTPAGTVSGAAVRRGDTTFVSIGGHTYEIKRHQPGASASAKGGSGESRAPMPGQIVEVTVAAGDVVEAGQKLLVLEAMKMQQTVSAGIAGTVMSVAVSVGEQVSEGQTMVLIAPGSQD